MKRIFLLLALLVFAAGAVNAEGMMFGIKGGLNLANVSGDDAHDDAKLKIAFGGGIWMSYAFTEAFMIQPELMFMMKGMDLDVEDEEGLALSYIDLNVLAKYAIPMEGDYGIALYAGPFVGMLMSAEFNEVDMKDDFASMAFGAIFGAEFAYMLESGCITLDARYSMGLTTIADFEDADEQPDIKTNGIQFMIGYGFPF